MVIHDGDGVVGGDDVFMRDLDGVMDGWGVVGGASRRESGGSEEMNGGADGSGTDDGSVRESIETELAA